MKNNISNLSINANYPTPDMAQMGAIVTKMSNLRSSANALFLLTQYLPTLNDKFTLLHTNIASTHRSLGDGAQKILHQITAGIGDIASYEKDLRDESLDEEDRAYLVEQILKSVTLVLTVVKAEDGSFNRQLGSIGKQIDRTQTEGFITEQEADIERYRMDVEQLDAKLKALSEQRKVLNNGIDALRSKGFAEMGNDVIGDVEKLIALGMTPPELAAVQLALEQTKKLLAEAERTITFFAMLKVLENLVDVINATTKNQIGKKDEIAIATHRINFIKTIFEMDTLRNGYLLEASKFTQATSFFLTQLAAGTGDEQVEFFIKNSQPFLSCMNDIAMTPR